VHCRLKEPLILPRLDYLHIYQLKTDSNKIIYLKCLNAYTAFTKCFIPVRICTLTLIIKSEEWLGHQYVRGHAVS
jgi:hypothetical protein